MPDRVAELGRLEVGAPRVRRRLEQFHLVAWKKSRVKATVDAHGAERTRRATCFPRALSGQPLSCRELRHRTGRGGAAVAGAKATTSATCRPPWRRSLTESGMRRRTTRSDVVTVAVFIVAFVALVLFLAMQT